MYTISKLTKAFGLSRSTLLYYDKIGLLSPSRRTAANYRLYTQSDYQRLEKIMLYKAAGLGLEDINNLISQDEKLPAQILERRLDNLNSEIAKLRNQQATLIALLGDENLSSISKTMNKQQWVAILRNSGMTEEDMVKWHQQFEASMPEVHTDFLQSLGIDDEEIARIKAF